ncbi:MAG: GxxExxY protein, partial [Anaerolineales bacterium]
MSQSARPEYDKTTYAIIGAAMEVHNELGPGFPEAIYRDAMVIALAEKGISAHKEVAFDVEYHGQRAGQFRLDMLAEEKVVVEFKAVSELTSQHEAQAIAYLTATGREVALLINFSAE